MANGPINMKHFVLGLLIGLVLFLGPGLITGNGGLLGSNLFPTLLSMGLIGLILLGVLYAAATSIIYGVILKLRKTPRVIKKSINFSIGIVLAYLIFWSVGLFAFSNFGF